MDRKQENEYLNYGLILSGVVVGLIILSQVIV